mgnify:CR=1 FL=1
MDGNYKVSLEKLIAECGLNVLYTPKEAEKIEIKLILAYE